MRKKITPITEDFVSVLQSISIALKWERVESMLSPLSLKSYGGGGGGGGGGNKL